jgi:hypothetical protein
VQDLAVVLPDGTRRNLSAELADLGMAPKEGYLATRFVTGKAGVHLVAHTADRIVNHGTPIRSLRNAKCAFVASNLLEQGAGSKVDPNHWTVFCRFLASEIPLGISLVPVTQA